MLAILNKNLKGTPMNAVIFKTQNVVFKFDQEEVKELIIRKKSDYDLDEVAKLLDQISDESNKTIVIPDEPVYFDRIALNLIDAGTGMVLCKMCNKTWWYSKRGQVNPQYLNPAPH